MTKRIFSKIVKRDGRLVKFDTEKIIQAIEKAGQATGEFDRKVAEKLAGKVLLLAKEIVNKKTPTVEEIQDIVELVLFNSPYWKTGRAYALYREQHRQIREIVNQADVGLVDKYLEKGTWEIRENSNMTFSLQGLNNYVASKITSIYWLNKIYPEEIRKAHEGGDFHIHDLCNLSVYCVGWDLYDLLLRGFGGVPGKIESKPAKHFRAALGQLVNFLFTLQGECAGAVAVSNFDTLLAPFIYYDKLSYQEVSQALQEFLFNMNVPTRVGFQCLSEDTKILTPEGWKSYWQIGEGDIIYTFNLKTGEIEKKEVTYIFKRYYQGYMYNLKNRSQDQLISPRHRVVRRKFNQKGYVLQPIEELLNLKSKIPIPTVAENKNEDLSVSEDQIKLLAWILSEGSIEKTGSHRVSIYQSQFSHPRNFAEIVNIIRSFNFEYTSHLQYGFGRCHHLRLLPSSRKIVHSWLGIREKRIPEYLFEMSKKQARIFLETYLKGDGWRERYRKRIITCNQDFAEAIAGIGVLAGYNCNIKKRIPKSKHSKKIQYVITLTKAKNDYITRIKKVFYKGVIWSPHTENETVIALRNGQVFITGNTPFSNITLDLTPSSQLANLPVIIGGNLQEKTYKEFQKEMDIFNKALLENFLKGDAKGRVFSFPIPTYNITKDFDWQNKNLDLLWEATAKYGLPYFANFINSEMKPDDVRSMCCRLRLSTKELRKRGGGLFGSNPLTGCYDEKTEILTEDGWKFFKDLSKEDKVFTLSKDNKIELQQVIELFQYDWRGEMYQFKGKSLDLLVTPNHRMVVDDKYQCQRTFVEARDFNFNRHLIPKGGFWQGEEKKWFVLPPVAVLRGTDPESHFSPEQIEAIRSLRKEEKSIYQVANRFDCHPVTIHNIWTRASYGNRERVKIQYITSPLRIKMDDWLRFFGFWLAEGSLDNERIASSHGWRVIIQVNKKKEEEIKRVLDRLPFHYYEEGAGIIICNKQLWSYLHQFGNKYTKFIPKEIKNLSRRQLRILFDWLVKGDGHIRKTNGQINYWTASKRLADDIQEIILKLGWMGTLTSQKSKTTQIRGKRIKPGIIYTLEVRKTKHYRLQEHNIKKVYYQGKVYCCQVPNHTVFVRRNGRVAWSGNSIGVVTINMPRLGYLSKNKKEFKERLAHLMNLAKTSLEIKRKTLEKFTESGLYPYSRFYLSHIKKKLGSYWKNHFSTIGLVGMNEACLNLFGENIASEKGRRFALEILDFMRKKLIEFQNETGNNYNLEATPAEGASYSLCLKDKERYPDIITAGTKENFYYTNSTQLPVNYTDDIFEALELQDELQCKYTGGTTIHLFLGERLPNGEMAKKLIKRVFEKFKLPYLTISPTFSVCPNHGYIAGEHFQCPKCKAECEVYSRVVGYLRPVNQWNDGKQEEFKQRKTFKVEEEK